MSSPTSVSYDIGRSAGVCAHSGRPLAAGEVAMVALVDRGPDQPLERFDVAEAHWGVWQRPAGVIACWKHTVPERADRGPALDPVSMMAVFDQLEGAESPRQVTLRYLLALVLLRKKHLVRLGVEGRDGVAVLVVRRRADGPEGAPVEVIEPALDTSLLADVTAQLEALIRTDASDGDA